MVANTCWNIFNFRKGLVNHFLANGDDVIVFAPHDEYTTAIESWGVRWVDTPMESTGVNPINDLNYFRLLYRSFKRESPDIVLGFTIKSNIYSCLAGRLSRVPVICNVSGLGTAFLVKGFTGRVAIALYKLAFRFAAHTFFQNDDDKALFTSHIALNEDLLDILPGSGIDLTEYQASNSSSGNKVKCLMVARLIVEKGVREYAEAASYFVDDERVSFTLIGKLDEDHARSISKEELDQWIAAGWLEYHSHFHPIKEVMREHEVIILPSYREGTPRTLLEGAALGKALIASDVPGCRHVVKDGHNGFLFQKGDVKELVDKIKLYMSLNEDEKIRLATNSRKHAEEYYDEKIVIHKYDEVIRRITSPS